MLLKCPGCGEWGALDDDQYDGRISVATEPDCSYHETHDFRGAVERAGGWRLA